MAEPILTPWVLSLSVVYVLYIQWIGHFLLKNRSQCNYPLAFRLWTYSTVNYLMKLRDIQLPSLSTYSGDIFEPTSATLACMHAPSSSNFERQVAVEFREACCIIIYYVVHVHKREWRHTACLSIYYYVCGMTSLALMRIQYCRFSVCHFATMRCMHFTARSTYVPLTDGAVRL